MAEKNVILKDGEDTLYPKTKAELVEGLPQGGAEWGGITGTLSNQTDLQNALNDKLNLSGGTMTGALKIDNSSNAYIKSTNDRDVLRASASDGNANVYLGNNLPGSRTEIQTGTRDVTHLRGSMQYDMLDSYNTAANAPLAGTEADLTSLKLNGTTYKIPSGGGSSSLYMHNVSLRAETSTMTAYMRLIIINASASSITEPTLKSLLADTSINVVWGYVIDSSSTYQGDIPFLVYVTNSNLYNISAANQGTGSSLNPIYFDSNAVKSITDSVIQIV